MLLVTRTARGVGAGALSIVLALDLARANYPTVSIGVVLGGALGGAAVWALAVPRWELRWSRRSVLAAESVAVVAGGILLWTSIANPIALLVALLLGGIVAGGADVSSLGALEQAALADVTPGSSRTHAYAVYNLLGYVGVAVGSLVAGPLRGVAVPGIAAPPHDTVLLFYGLLGASLVAPYRALSKGVERPAASRRPSPLSPEGRRVVLSLSALFAVDAFAGGMIVNTLVVFYFVARYAPTLSSLGLVFFASSLAAALSLVLALPLARRFGLVNTIVFTHIPSSVLLLVLALAPTFPLAAAVWVVRATLSQMDVPTRQSYTQGAVAASDRAAAAGYTTAARSSQALGAPVTGALFAAGGPLLAAPFLLAGSVKIAYDLAFYQRFRQLLPPEERGGPRRRVGEGRTEGD